jgi:quinol monooxygenase YgiN
MSSVRTNSKASQRTGDEITNAVLVGYKVKPEHVERNRELADGFLRELSAARLANRYAVFTLADGVSFVHLHFFADEAEEKQFTQLPSFRTFEKDLAERCEEPPAVSKLEAVGSYGWFGALRHEPADLSRRNDWKPNLKTVIVRYKVKPEHAERNRELVHAVYSELELTQLADFNYATFVLDDGVSFVHLAAHGHETNPLPNLPAFQAFQEGIGERCAEQPVVTELNTIGAYGWFEQLRPRGN